MLRVLLPSLASTVLLAAAPAAHALVPDDLFAVSGKPGANAFLPGLANDSSLVDATPGTSFVMTPNNRRISSEGRYVAFASKADALMAGDDDRFINLYVQDGTTGAVTLVSAAAPGGVVDGDSIKPALSDDGRTVAFVSRARLSPVDTDGERDVYVRDLDAGTTVLASPGDGAADEADLSGNGEVVAFTTEIPYAESLDGAGSDDVYAVDLTALPANPQLVSRTIAEKGAGDSSQPALDQSGDRIAFQTKATNLDDAGNPDPVGDTYWDVYVRDRAAGTTTLISRAAGAGGAKGNDNSTDPAIGPAGNLVAFRSDANNLDPGDTSHNGSVFLRNTGLNTVTLVSRKGATSANGHSDGPTISFPSGGALRVAFISSATNIDPAATTDTSRAWVYTAGTMALVGRENGATGAPVGTYGPPSISADGAHVAFAAGAPGLSSEDDDRYASVYVRSGETTTWRSRPQSGPWRNGAENAGPTKGGVSADGRYVLFTSGSGAFLSAGDPVAEGVVVRRDVVTGATVVVSRATGPAGAPALSAYEGAISADGNRVAFTSRTPLVAGAPADTSQVYVRDIAAGTTVLVSRNGGQIGDADASQPAISADGRKVAFMSKAANLGQPGTEQRVWIHDLATGQTSLVSRAGGANGVPADEPAGSPSVDADGSRVAFNSYATNLHPDDGDTKYSIFVRDLAANTTILASRGPGGVVNDAQATDPDITGDGTRVAFVSSATNLSPADGDGGAYDVFFRDLGASTTTLGSTPGDDYVRSGFDLSHDGGTLAWATDEALLPEDTDADIDTYLRTLPGGAAQLVGRKGGGQPLDGNAQGPQLSADAGCLVLSIAGSGEYSEGPLPSPGLPGSVPSPDFSEVLLRALKPTCAPPPVVTPPPGPRADTTAPQITGAQLSRKRFRVGRRPTARTAAKRGTAFKFTLSEAATVTIALKKAAKGRKKAGRCVKPTRKLRERKACIRYVAKGKLTRAGVPAGAVRVKFTGRVGRRALRPGRYRAVLRATDAAGNRSAAVKLAFRVVRR